MRLRDTHVVITGGSTGVGAALARELRSRGARLTLVARPSTELETTAKETQPAGTSRPPRARPRPDPERLVHRG